MFLFSKYVFRILLNAFWYFLSFNSSRAFRADGKATSTTDSLAQKLNLLLLDVCASMANTADRVCTKIENIPLQDNFKGFD
jgi:hypothetical protein